MNIRILVAAILMRSLSDISIRRVISKVWVNKESLVCSGTMVTGPRSNSPIGRDPLVEVTVTTL